MEDQILDSMDIERERGITIKAQAVSLNYEKEGVKYLLNFIDTPGHVDFSYEVSRSLSACEGALLVVDGSQGVEAQTLANCYTAVEEGLEVVPVINKIDLPQAEPDRVKDEIEEMVGINANEAPLVSAKTGEGVEILLDKLISDKLEKKASKKDSKPKTKKSSLNELVSSFVEIIESDDWFNKRKDVEELRSKINSILKPSESDTDEFKKSKSLFFQTLKTFCMLPRF